MGDSFVNLALQLDAAPGTYALLLGSGISRSAGILTGYEIVLDLIHRVAAARGESCEPEPVEWLRNTLKLEPDYSDLLEQLAQTPASRRALLHGYFEPTDEERARGVKVPSEAHRAIARLVVDGYARIIITTNFDPLLEQAIREAGINPVVISTPAGIVGMEPIQHQRCLVLKIHGDYLDAAIRNTLGELEKYDSELDVLLDRIFDEYGSIVCGWSAKWDPALRAALERVATRRYPVFWLLRRDPSVEEEKLITGRRAEVLRIEGAEEFFSRLHDRLRAMRAVPGAARIEGGGSVTPEALQREVTKLVDQGSIPALRRMAIQQASTLADAIGEKNFPSTPAGEAVDVVAQRITAYDQLVSPAVAIMATGGFWATAESIPVFTKMLEVVMNAGPAAGNSILVDLARYPAAVMLYAGGVAAVASGRYDSLARLLLDAKHREVARSKPAVTALAPWHVLDYRLAQKMPWLKQPNLLVPLSEHLHDRLREPLRDVIPIDWDYQDAFDRYEYLAALIEAGQHGRGYIGRFGYRSEYNGPEDAVSIVKAEIAAQREEWPLVGSAFGGDISRLDKAMESVDEDRGRFRWR